MRAVLFIALMLVTLIKPTPAYAFFSEIWGYMKQYRLGIDYTNSSDHVRVNYRTNNDGKYPEGCAEDTKDVGYKRCYVDMTAGSSSGFGLLLQQPFRRQGLFYFDMNVSFGARYLQGVLPASEANVPGAPLQSLDFRLGAAVVKPYLQFGITPEHFPDLLVSAGPAIQVSSGTVSIDGKKKDVVLGTSSGVSQSGLLFGFTQIEIVFVRFHDGLLSVFSNQDFTNGSDGTVFYPGAVDGMQDFRADFHHNVGGGASAFGTSFGLKIVLNWP